MARSRPRSITGTLAGDPNLHTHLVIANKVQGHDGQWRAIDGRALYNAAVACSEIYDTTVADLLAQRLPVTFGYRDRGPRRTPAYEIDGIPGSLLAAFSSRSAAIGEHVQDLVAAFTDAHGREPDRVETIRLRQQATLATRPDKHVAPLAELRARWRATAETVTGQPAQTIAHGALTSGADNAASVASTGPAIEVPDALLGRYADATVAAVSTRRATWSQMNLLAEAARTTRALRVPDPGARIALLDRVVAAALERCIALDPPENRSTVERYTHPEAASHRAEPAFTTWSILAAEARLLTAHEDTAAPTADPQPIAAAAAARTLPGTPTLSAEQAAAAAHIASSARRMDVLVGPAGTGKTRALYALRAAWEQAHGRGSVIGLAPSARAAAELAASLRIGTDTLAKWIHETDPITASGGTWSLQAGQLVLVDEAAMASTDHLDRLVAQARLAGAKVVLVGDHCQLGSIDAGGAFALLLEEGNAVELEHVHRFTEDWESAATRRLRVGDPAALDAYDDHDRLHDGPREAMTERAYRAWAADTGAGLNSLLLGADRDTVTTLNRRARADRLRTGQVDQGIEVALHDSTTAGPGDHIVTRRNDRRLTQPDGQHVRNGDRWLITAVHADGSLDVTAADRPDRQGGPPAVRLPAEYVRRHVELGYALTVHRAQGATADTAHLLAGPGLHREALYVGLTRGRRANHAYVATESSAYEDHVAGDPLTGRQVLEAILRSPATETSATSTLRQRQAEHLAAFTRAGRWPPPDAQTAGPSPPCRLGHLRPRESRDDSCVQRPSARP